jgi:hypothetical protein
MNHLSNSPTRKSLQSAIDNRQSTMSRLILTPFVFTLLLVLPAAAQQRPLLTEDPESIGAGLLLLEGGFDYARDQPFPVSGLTGHLVRVPLLGLSVGISSIAEVQIDGVSHSRLAIKARAPAPLSASVTATGEATSSSDDLVIGAKIKFASETARRPAFGVRFATRLPNASNESGLGLDTMNFHATLLVGKTVESIRVVGNVGLGILSDPTRGDRQNDVLLYGASIARAFAPGAEFVGEINGHASTRRGTPPPGTDSSAALRLGVRYTRGTVRVDGGLFAGMTSRDPSIGFTAGATWVFRAFEIP